MLDADGGDNRQAGAQATRQVGIVECNLHSDSLHHLRKITGGVVGWQQRKLRAASRSNFDHFAAEHLSRVLVDEHLRRIAHFYVRQLRLAIVGLDPFCFRYES